MVLLFSFVRRLGVEGWGFLINPLMSDYRKLLLRIAGRNQLRTRMPGGVWAGGET